MKVGPTIGGEQWGERRGNQKSDFNVWIVKNNQQDPSAPSTITISESPNMPRYIPSPPFTTSTLQQFFTLEI